MTEAEVKLATCEVLGVDEAGTGWVVSDTLVLTAYHCLGESVAQGFSVELSFGAGPTASKQQALLEAFDEDLDVCLLRLSSTMEIEPIPLAIQPSRPGKQWQAFGYPVTKLQIGHVLQGSVQQTLTELANGIDLDLSVSPETTLSDYRGMSGAALVTSDGCQGMLRVSVDNALGAVSMAAMREFLADNQLLPEEEESEEQTFPYGPRPSFDELFDSTLVETGGGYLFLDGAHGIGKSTYCRGFTPESSIVDLLGVYAFSERGRGYTPALQAQPEVFVDWLTSLLSERASGKPARLTQSTYAQLIQTTHQVIEALAKRCSSDWKVGVLFLDGLNEVAAIGDDALQRFIGLLPARIPDGLVIVAVGAGLDAIASKLSPLLQTAQRMTLPVLGEDVQYGLCASMLDEDKVSPTLVSALCARAKGHPLYLRYLVDLINGGADVEDLELLPLFSGAIEDYYETIWSQLLTDADAVNLLAIIARLRWGIPTSDVPGMLTAPESTAFVPTFTRIRHLLAAPDTTEVYHSSFSDFVVHKTAAQSAWVEGRLADFCLLPSSGAYGELNRVFHGLRADSTRQLAAIGGCQQQWVDRSVLLGAEPDVLLGDIEDSLDAATRVGTATEIVRLLLLSQRLKFRYDTLFAQSAHLAAEALIALNKTDQALRHILRHGHLIVGPEEAFAIVRLLIEAGHEEEAVEVIRKVDRLLQPILTSSKVTVTDYLNAAATRLRAFVLADHAGFDPSTFEFLEHVVRIVRDPRNSISDENAQRAISELIGSMLGTDLCIKYSYKPLSKLPIPPGTPNKAQAISLLAVLAYAHLHANEYKVRLPREPIGMLLEDIASRLDDTLGPDEKNFDIVALLIQAGANHNLVETYATGLIWDADALPLFAEHRSLANSETFVEAYSRLRAAYFLGRRQDQPQPGPLEVYDWEENLVTLASAVAWIDAKARRASASNDETELAAAKKYLNDEVLPCLRLELASRASWREAYFIPENIVPILYGHLAAVCLDSMPDAVTDLLDLMEHSFEVQLGLYNEGFQRALQAVIPALVGAEVSESISDRVFDLLIRWRDYVRDNVQNRRELVPELLSMVPLLARMGSDDQALNTYHAVLAASMGPSWYKEDQFAVMSRALEALPAEAEVSSSALAQVAAYLERASGEMTFQRYVRTDKGTFIGELSRRGMYSSAVRYFQHQACGTIDEMHAQASDGGLDRIAPLIGMRYPAGSLEEQASLLSLLEHVGTHADWKVRWAVLELYQHGDERHLRDWGLAYAKIIQEIASNAIDLAWAVQRIGSIAQSMNAERAWMLLQCLLKALPDALSGEFDGLLERYRNVFRPEQLEALSRRSGIPLEARSPKSPAASTPAPGADSANEQDEERSPPGLEAMRGTFGTGASVKAAEKSLEEARKHIKRRNMSAAIDQAISALTAVQDGGWSIWSKGHPARIADLIIDEHVSSADELARLYGPLAVREQHTQSWTVAYQLIELIGPKLGADQRTQLLTVATDHVREMVGLAPSEAFSYIGAVKSESASDALLELLLWALDHPSWEQRDTAAAMVLWLLRSDDAWMAKLGSLAFSMESRNRADIAAASLDVLSRENPEVTWERLARFVDVNGVAKSCAHASRYSTLLRIAERASSKGVVSASDAVRTLKAKQITSRAATAKPVEPLRPDQIHSSLRSGWLELKMLGALDEHALERVVSELHALCGTHSFDDVQKLEFLAAERYREPTDVVPDRWAARIRFALNVALFEPASIEQLAKIEAALRIYNPETLLEPPDGRPLISSLTEAVSSGKESGFLPSSGDLIFLDLQCYLERRFKTVRVDLTSHLLPPGQREPHLAPLSTFKPTELPRPSLIDQLSICGRVQSGIAHFGSLTPSIPSPQFQSFVHATASDFVRYHWRDGSTVRSPGTSRRHEASVLAIRREALTLPPGWRMQWILRVDGQIRSVINKAH